MKKSLQILLFSLLSLSTPLHTSASPFNTGESLEFRLSWGGITAGTTVMEVPDMVKIEGRQHFHLRSKTWSSDFVSTFYKLDNRIDCYIDIETFKVQRYEVLTEEKKRKKKESAHFDYVKSEVLYTKRGKKRIVKVPPDIYDSLSSFYYLRTIPLEPGSEFSMNTFSAGKVFGTTVKVVGREKIRVDAGTFDTIKVHTIIKEGDVFKSKGNTFIWFTDDEQRIPVMIKTKINVGSITARLKGLKRGN